MNSPLCFTLCTVSLVVIGVAWGVVVALARAFGYGRGEKGARQLAMLYGGLALAHAGHLAAPPAIAMGWHTGVRIALWVSLCVATSVCIALFVLMVGSRNRWTPKRITATLMAMGIAAAYMATPVALSLMLQGRL